MFKQPFCWLIRMQIFDSGHHYAVSDLKGANLSSLSYLLPFSTLTTCLAYRFSSTSHTILTSRQTSSGYAMTKPKQQHSRPTRSAQR